MPLPELGLQSQLGPQAVATLHQGAPGQVTLLKTEEFKTWISP